MARQVCELSDYLTDIVFEIDIKCEQALFRTSSNDIKEKLQKKRETMLLKIREIEWLGTSQIYSNNPLTQFCFLYWDNHEEEHLSFLTSKLVITTESYDNKMINAIR